MCSSDLPELTYVLYLLPHRLYVKDADRRIGTADRAKALRLNESLARAQALALIRSTAGLEVELRHADPTDNDRAGGAS